MGMAASQARLLTITARMHDVEYQAQSIQNAKIQLATQSDAVYQKYLDALDATTLTIKSASGELIPANFNNLCGMYAIESATNTQYMFRASDNSIIVPNDIAAAYDEYTNKYMPDDPYMFALYMCGGDSVIGTDKEVEQEEAENTKKLIEAAEDFVATHSNSKRLEGLKEARDRILSPEKLSEIGIKDEGITIEDIQRYAANSESKEDKEKYEKIIDSYNIANSKYKTELYKTGDNAQIIYHLLEDNLINYDYEVNDSFQSIKDIDYSENEIDKNKFNYYVKMYKAIQANDGDISPISDYDGINGIGDAGNDNEWLQNMIKSGKITVDELTIDANGIASYVSTGISSNSELAYTTTSTIDKKALAKAEAEYEHETKLIDQKDKKFDMDLNKLETEREALKTEYESVKKVISDNIERTFGIFS